MRPCDQYLSIKLLTKLEKYDRISRLIQINMRKYNKFIALILTLGTVIPGFVGFAEAKTSYSNNAAYIIGGLKQGVSSLPTSNQMTDDRTSDKGGIVTTIPISDSDTNPNSKYSSLRYSKIKITLFDKNNGKVYANGRDYFKVEFSVLDHFGNYLPNQPLIANVPSGVSVAGDLNSMNGVTTLFFRSDKVVSSRCYIALQNDSRVKKYFSLNFKKISYKITDRTDRQSFNSDCPITFVAEIPASSEFVRGEVVYEYGRITPVLFWKDVRHTTLTQSMFYEGGNWISEIRSDNTSRSKVSMGRFSYYYRFYDRFGHVFQSKRYQGRLSNP